MSASPLDELIARVAEGCIRNRSRVERSELAASVWEAIVADVVERDPRFYRRASFYGLEARRRSDERGRIAKEEAEAAGVGQDLEPVHLLEPYGFPLDAA